MGTRTKVTWSGTVNFTYEGRDLVAEVKATAQHWYQAGRMYMPNGDPGYPTEDEIDDIEFDVNSLVDAETEEAVTYTEDMVNDIESAIHEQAEWEEDENPYDDGPDADYYEEAAIAKYEADCERFGY